MKQNNRKLYESIMKDVSKVVKRKLNESYSEDDLFDALNYVMKYIDKEEINYLVYKMNKERCPAHVVNSSLLSDIIDYMNEFAEDNDLPEDFWTDELDDDDLVFKLYDLYNDI